jgi:hypothetical protein
VLSWQVSGAISSRVRFREYAGLKILMDVAHGAVLDSALLRE